jgi:hypothetical protein
MLRKIGWTEKNGVVFTERAAGLLADDGTLYRERQELSDISTSLEKSDKPSRIRYKKRRARDSNPQPVSRHLISSQAAHHSHTLRGTWLNSASKLFARRRTEINSILLRVIKPNRAD